MKRGAKPKFIRDGFNCQARVLKQFFGLAQAQLQVILLGGRSDEFPERVTEGGIAYIKLLGDGFDIDQAVELGLQSLLGFSDGFIDA